MSFDLNPSDYKEPELLPKGQYECSIISAEEKEFSNDKGTGKYIRMGIRCIDPMFSNTQLFNHSLWMPDRNEEKSYQPRLRQALSFCKAVGYDLTANGNQIIPDLLVDLTFFAKVDLETGRDGVVRNCVKSFVEKR